MHTQRFHTAVVVALLASATAANAQQTTAREPLAVAAKPFFQIIEAAPLESISLVKNAPFYAEAVTEFTQILGDGNRIERRYVSSVARDSRGRTRREEEIALVGPFAATGPSPRLMTIVDPDARTSYTLDENLRVAYRNFIALPKLVELTKLLDVAREKIGGGGRGAIMAAPVAGFEGKRVAAPNGGAGASTVTESLGTRPIEGVMAEGTRTTSTIPAGTIGNLLPIEIVAERWFSPELQMAVLITRRDPRAGETVYRLTNIVRAEQADALFVVPPDYELRDGNLATGKFKMIEASKIAPKKK